MSLPPPGLPPEVGLRTRFRVVTSELSEQTNPSLQAALLFELGALSELRGGDRAKALDYYRRAEQRDTSFRPALFARARLLYDAHDHDAILPILAKLTQLSVQPRDAASAFVELGCLLEDQLSAPGAAQEAFERALRTDPSCLAASLMQERSLLVHHRRDECVERVAERASHTLDPVLRSSLAIEAARALAAGHTSGIDAAIEALVGALALPGRQLATLRCLAELCIRHGRPLVAARACEDLGALLSSFAASATSAGAATEPASLEIASYVGTPERALQAAAYYYHTAARLRAEDASQADDTLRAYARAAHCAPRDVLLGLSLAAAYQSIDALGDARALLESQREHADPRAAAALAFELAEIAERQGDSGEALAYLQAAHAAAPDAPTISAVLEDRLLDAGDLDTLTDELVARARASEGGERRVFLWRAALAAERARTPERSLALWAELVNQCEGPERNAALREWHGLAARTGSSAQLQAAAEELLESSTLAKAERSALWRSRYEAALATRELELARALLHEVLRDPACDEWSGHTAWLVAALQRDRGLLAVAHRKLAAAAEQRDDPQLAAAHLTGQGRALLLADDSKSALPLLRRALELAPGNAYTRGLIERCLRTQAGSDPTLRLLLDSEWLARDEAQADLADDKRVQQAASVRQAQLAEAAGDLTLARRHYDAAVALEPGSFEVQWTRLRFAEREHDRPGRLRVLRALAEREAAQRRPGNAHLELGEALAALGEFAAAAPYLAAAVEHEASAFEAAASIVLLPRGEAADAARPRALSELAEQTTRQLRRSLEHERSAELLHQCPEDARRLFDVAQANDARDAFLRFLLLDGSAHAPALEGLRALVPSPEQQAELMLHGARCRALFAPQRDDDALVNALALFSEAPQSLPAALALCEALDASDDPETRVAALAAWREHVPEAQALDISAALARALLDAGAAGDALGLLERLLQALPDDPSLWESMRVAARMAGDAEKLVLACDALAKHTPFPVRAELLEEAAGVLHERLDQHAEAELRLRQVLANVPERRPAFERLHDVLVEREDLDGLLALLGARIAVSDSGDERVDLLYERARILRARGDRAGALSSAEELLAHTPAHTGALGLCAEIHATEENWQAAVAALQRLAGAELTPAQRRLALEGAADFLEHRVGDPAAAYRELEKLLGHDLADFAVNLRMARLAERAGLRREAADATARAAAQSRGVQRAQLERKAAELYTQLADSSAATAALQRALIAHPGDEQAFSLLYAQMSEASQREQLARDFVDTLLQALAATPLEPDLLRTLVHTGRLTAQPHLAQLGLFALTALGQATRDERLEAERLRGALPEYPARSLDTVQFTALLPSDLSPALLTLGQALSSAWLESAPDARPGRKEGRSARPAPLLTAPAGAAEALRAGLSIFGLTLSELFVSDSEPEALHPLRRAGTTQTWVVGRDLRLGTRELLLRAAPLMAATRARLLGLALDNLSAVRHRIQLVLVAVGASEDPALTREAAGIAGKLSRSGRAGVLTAWEALDAAQRPEASLRLAHALLTLSRRAALIVSSDLFAVAAGLPEARNGSLRAACATPQGVELLRFWLSPTYAEWSRASREVRP